MPPRGVLEHGRHASRSLQTGMHMLAQGGPMLQQVCEHACPGHHVNTWTGLVYEQVGLHQQVAVLGHSRCVNMCVCTTRCQHGDVAWLLKDSPMPSYGSAETWQPMNRHAQIVMQPCI